MPVVLHERHWNRNLNQQHGDICNILTMNKLYIVQKYVIASSISEALKKERDVKPSDVFLDNDFKKANMPDVLNPKKIGFVK